MLYEQHDWNQEAGNGVSVKELMETLRSGKHITNNKSQENARKQAEELEKRLLRVRSWGGAFTEIEFSPDIQMLLNGTLKRKPGSVLAL